MEPVIIVGSGMAGAAAALKLGKAGIAACVLEAQERIGGRAFSRPYAGTDDTSLLEYGGSWITPFHERIRALTPEMGLYASPTCGRHTAVGTARRRGGYTKLYFIG